jgi:hypothetical protein
MNWRELYEERDSGGDEVLDVWIKNGEAIAYQCMYRGRPITVMGEGLVPKAPPKRYSFMEAVALMEQGKVMRAVSWPKAVCKIERQKHSAPEFFTYRKDTGDYVDCTMSLADVKAEWEEVPS